MIRTAADCRTMAEIRAEIDRVDSALVALFAERVRYIDRAAVIKTKVGLPARIADRVEDVVAKVRAHAVTHGLPPDKLEKLWRRLIDWSIEREEDVLGPGHADGKGRQDGDKD
jgi:isochorismate pyruvate lyase